MTPRSWNLWFEKDHKSCLFSQIKLTRVFSAYFANKLSCITSFTANTDLNSFLVNFHRRGATLLRPTSENKFLTLVAFLYKCVFDMGEFWVSFWWNQFCDRDFWRPRRARLWFRFGIRINQIWVWASNAGTIRREPCAVAVDADDHSIDGENLFSRWRGLVQSNIRIILLWKFNTH